MGKVVAVCISEQKGTQKESIGTADFIENHGIKNDAHAGNWHRQISLLSKDKIEAFRLKGIEIPYGAFGENLVVEEIDFAKLPKGIVQTAEATKGWYQKNKFSLLRRDKMMLAATNDYWPVVQEADIKIMEMVPIMTRSFELEEFIHGPQNAFNDEMLFFILSKAGEDEQKVTAIANFLKSEIGFCSVVGECARDDKDLKLVPMSKYFSPLEMVTAFQLLAYYMATDKGRDLSRGVNTSITNYITKTINK